MCSNISRSHNIQQSHRNQRSPKPNSHERGWTSMEMFLKQFSEKQGPFFIPKLPSVYFLSLPFFPFQHLLLLSLHTAEKIARLLLDGPWLWAPGQFPWFPDTVHHQQPDGGRGRTGRQERERESKGKERKRAIKNRRHTAKEGRREKQRREKKKQWSLRTELPPSGLSFRNKNLITWLFP